MINHKFLKKNEAGVFLSTPDSFTKEMNLTNIQFVDKSLTTMNQYLNHLYNSTLDFSEKETKSINKIMDKINRSLESAQLFIKLDIGFIKTNGTDSFDLPYTRGSNIILPSKQDEIGGNNMNIALISHEIFHILTRRDPSIRDALYKLCGFHQAQHEIITNQTIDKMIVNPDALEFKYYAKCMLNDVEIKVLPLILINENNKMEWVSLAKLDDNLLPVSLVTIQSTNYMSLYAKASNYVSHPEEICAENFRNIVISKNVNEEFLKRCQIIFIDK